MQTKTLNQMFTKVHTDLSVFVKSLSWWIHLTFVS